MSLSISPPNGVYDISPTTEIVVLGSTPSEPLDYSTLLVTINGVTAYDGGPIRPDFAARLVKTSDNFTLTVTPRRAFLHRVKIDVAAQITRFSVPMAVTGESSFTTRDPSASLSVGVLRRLMDADFTMHSTAALSGVFQQTRALLGGATNGAFWVRVIRRSYLSQSWPLVRAFCPDVEEPMSEVSADDARFPDPDRMLSLVEILWDAARKQLEDAGFSHPASELLNKSFRSSNPMERVGAACTLILIAQHVGSRSQDEILALRANGYL